MRNKPIHISLVAPLVGAWIEILKIGHNLSVMGSLPSWERGLKYLHGYGRMGCRAVAPLVGAWIEICGSVTKYSRNSVAPLVGAWIEIL